MSRGSVPSATELSGALHSPDSLGLAGAIEAAAALATAAMADIEFRPLPKEALPEGLVVAAPHVAVTVSGKGEVKIESLAPLYDALRGKPARRTGIATTTTLDSFIDLVNRHANTGTAIFVDANWRAPKLTAVIDYHLRGTGEAQSERESVAGDDPLARFGQHRVAYAFPLSEPWKVWVEHNAKPMPQAEFALFLEEHIHELAAPDLHDAREAGWQEMFRTKIADPTVILDLSRGLEVKVAATVKSKVKLQSGETQMVFETSHHDALGNELIVPGLFLISVPLFYRGEPCRVPARLRYRVGGGAILWSYELFRPDEFVEEHVRVAVEHVNAATGITVYDGAPEMPAR